LEVANPAPPADLLSPIFYVSGKEIEGLNSFQRCKTADKVPTPPIQDRGRLKDEEIESSSPTSLYSQDEDIETGQDPPCLEEQRDDQHEMREYSCFKTTKDVFADDKLEPEPTSLGFGIKYSEQSGTSQASLSASLAFTNHSGLPAPYSNLVQEPKTTPAAVLYLVHPETRQAVTTFLQDYAGTNPTAPYALLMIDASISNFTGCILTTLCLNPRGENCMREAEEGEKAAATAAAAPLRIDTAMLTGESVLIPQNHDPWVFMQCLLDERLVRLAAAQPRVSRSNRVQREYDSGAESYERFVLDFGARSIVEEAQILALEKLKNPTMAKFDWRQGGLVWAGWGLLLEDVLQSEWDEKVRELVGVLEEEGQECTEGECVMVCHSVKVFKQQWLLAEVMASVEGRYTGPAVGLRQCKRPKWKSLQQYGMA
jgi:hypothetical protein